MQRETKGGQYALHSQSIQLVCQQFLANVETIKQLRTSNPRHRYPYHPKQYRTVHWPAQAVCRCGKRLILPMGRGRQSFSFHLPDLPERIGAVSLVWRGGYELHLVVPVAPEADAPEPAASGVQRLYVGDPHGVRNENKGRHHNQRMAQWEYGKDKQYLQEKCAKVGIVCFSGSERGTGSRCPRCDWRKKPKGRNWTCRRCGFVGHRDIVGSMNMHLLAFGSRISYPSSLTYRRPGPLRDRRQDKELSPSGTS